MKKIVIVKLSAIGDVIHALPVAAALKRYMPDCHISWVVEQAAYELVANHPYIDEVILFDKPKVKSVLGFFRYAPGFLGDLRRRKFDIALDLQGLLKSALIAGGSGAPKRLVYENSREGSDWLAEKVVGPNSGQAHVTERYLDVVRHLGFAVPTGEADYGLKITGDELAASQRLIAHHGLDMAQKYAVLVLGANWPNKIWPQEHFANVANVMYETGLIPVVVGGPADSQLASLMMEATAIPPVDLTGKTTLRQLAAVLQQAAVVIGGDTGPMHLAAALATPTVALMGPTDEARNGPYGQGHVVLKTVHDCAGCWQRSCPKKWDCLATISPTAVLRAVQKIGR